MQIHGIRCNGSGGLEPLFTSVSDRLRKTQTTLHVVIGRGLLVGFKFMKETGKYNPHESSLSEGDHWFNPRLHTLSMEECIASRKGA